MGKRKNPETSLEAFRSLDPIKVSQTMQKIADAIKALGKGNYEMVAAHTGMPEAKVWKRFIDCVRAGLIHRTDETVKTSHGNKSFLFAPGPASEPLKKKQRVMKGPTVSDFTRAIKQVAQSPNTIERLF